jgi:hypothetical protein
MNRQIFIAFFPLFALHAASATTNLTARLAEVQRMAPAGFTVFAEPPFVVAGDEPAAVVRQRSRQTIRWAVDKLKQDFFQRDPEEVIAVWLFKDETSYKKHTAALFHDRPTTPFGYYSEMHNALIMNIATGGGTLVHEIVHPFMSANFPKCPAWFNEGLGSLFEQCAEKGGHIRGLPNWRLPALQKALRGSGVQSFQKLTALSTEEFYGGENNPHYNQFYPQARYLCYYLQERGLLVKFYREFTAHAAEDPTGYTTLQRILGEKDMDAFQKKWIAFTLQLKFP